MGRTTTALGQPLRRLRRHLPINGEDYNRPLAAPPAPSAPPPRKWGGQPAPHPDPPRRARKGRRARRFSPIDCSPAGRGNLALEKFGDLVVERLRLLDEHIVPGVTHHHHPCSLDPRAD